jgi:hypothetical protein
MLSVKNLERSKTKKHSLLEIIQTPQKNSAKYTAYHSISDNNKENQYNQPNFLKEGSIQI